MLRTCGFLTLVGAFLLLAPVGVSGECHDCLENGGCVSGLPWGYQGCTHAPGSCSVVPFAQCWPGGEDADFAMDGTVHFGEGVKASDLTCGLSAAYDGELRSSLSLALAL